MQQKLTTCIQELLHRYDCVVVPGFGGFVCNFEPARIHPVQHKFYPPAKSISFNQLLQLNDGLLAHFLARTDGIAYEQAVEMIRAESEQWKKQLRNGERLQLDSIGDFYYDHQDKLLFQADKTKNYLIDSYGLTIYQSLPINKSQKLNVVHSAKSAPASDNEKSTFAWNKFANYSSAAAMISLIALTTFKLNLLEDVQLNTASLNPFTSETGVYHPLPYGEIKDFATADESVIKTKIDDATTNFMEYPLLDKKIIVKLNNEMDEKTVEKIPAILGPYHVVAGCFGVEKNATKLHKKLIKKGYKADLSGMHKGLHVVSYQSFDSRNAANELLDKVRAEDNAQAWILKK